MATNPRLPVVLIHGFATSTERTWTEPGWFDLLADAGRPAIGVDLLGHGDAPKPTDPSAYLDLASPALEHFPDGQVDLIGYSLGAHTALKIASLHPERIRKMVLAGVGRNVVEAETIDVDAPSGHSGMEPHIIQRFEALIATAGSDGVALRACMSVERPRFRLDQLSDIDIPCLVIMGDEDFAGPPQPLADALPNAKVKLLPRVDHFGLPKHFDFIDAALEFIDAVPDWS